MLIVIVVVAIMAAVVIPNYNASLPTDLQAAAELVAAELDYARSLAVTYGSSYRAAGASSGRELLLTHSGDNGALDELPPGPFHRPGDPPDRRILRLDELGGVAGSVRIAGMTARGDSSSTKVDDVEFGPWGETTRAETTVVWLVGGSGHSARYLPIEIHPITGLATIGAISVTRPGELQAVTVNQVFTP